MPISHCQHHLRQELSVDAEPTIARTLGSLKYMYNIICKPEKRGQGDNRAETIVARKFVLSSPLMIV